MKKNVREFKGRSLFECAKDYTVVDLETTGLNPSYSDIIEVGAIRVRNDEIVYTYQQLINPGYSIPSYITNLTGITNEMLYNAPSFDDVADEILEFVGDDLILGHNVNFDINFLYDKILKSQGIYFSNSFVDTLRMARKLCPELPHHRLCSLTEYFDVEVTTAHRALADCESTFEVYKHLKILMNEG